VPRDIRAGDTPDGQPAIIWNAPPQLDRLRHRRDWGSGGTAEQAFWEFMRLAAEEEVERFVAFAQQFGPLGLWPFVTRDNKKIAGLDYWVPGITEGIMTPRRFTHFRSGDEYQEVERIGLLYARYEPVAEWRRWARWLQTIVSISFVLRQGNHASRRDWEALEVAYLTTGDFLTNLDRQRSVLTDIVHRRFLIWSGLVPVLRWEAEHPTLTLALGGADAVTMHRSSFRQDWSEHILFPALVAQLLAVITAGEHVTRCSWCGQLHSRSRRARIDQPAYCSDACRHEAIKRSKRMSARSRRLDSKIDSNAGERK
jgi:hypothetical protein